MGNAATASVFAGKKILCFGDSTTDGDDGFGAGGPSISWTAHLGGLLGCTDVACRGVRGSCLVEGVSEYESFVERLGRLDTDGDIYVLFGGVNDFCFGSPLGQMGSADPRDFYGALDMVVRGIAARAPEARLVMMTPCKTCGKPEYGFPGSFDANSRGLVQKAYVDAMLEVADYYSAPVIDLYAGSGISPYLPEHCERYMPDGLHYSPAGYERLARRIAAGLRAVLG
jgi:lysophospholipase L1-like esterase